MALQTVRVASYMGNLATVSIEYDDAAMVMTQAVVVNGTEQPVTFSLHQNRKELYTLTVEAGSSANVTIPGSQPISFTNGYPDFGNYIITTRYG